MDASSYIYVALLLGLLASTSLADEIRFEAGALLAREQQQPRYSDGVEPNLLRLSSLCDDDAESAIPCGSNSTNVAADLLSESNRAEVGIAFDPYGRRPHSPFSTEYAPNVNRSFWSSVKGDYLNFYSRDSLIRLAVGFGIGGVMANTNIDYEIQRRFQASVRNATSDDWFETLQLPQELGNEFYVVPIIGSAWLGATLLDEYFPEIASVGDWGERVTRGFLLGTPHNLAFQVLTGASRPNETAYKSHWRPLKDANGVSGHSFVSALPFITAAKMTERPALKGVLYLASMAGPIQRINDDAHFTSQAFLGWWVAYSAATSVVMTEDTGRRWQMVPYVDSNLAGIALDYRF